MSPKTNSVTSSETWGTQLREWAASGFQPGDDPQAEEAVRKATVNLMTVIGAATEAFIRAIAPQVEEFAARVRRYLDAPPQTPAMFELFADLQKDELTARFCSDMIVGLAPELTRALNGELKIRGIVRCIESSTPGNYRAQSAVKKLVDLKVDAKDICYHEDHEKKETIRLLLEPVFEVAPLALAGDREARLQLRQHARKVLPLLPDRRGRPVTEAGVVGMLSFFFLKTPGRKMGHYKSEKVGRFLDPVAWAVQKQFRMSDFDPRPSRRMAIKNPRFQ